MQIIIDVPKYKMRRFFDFLRSDGGMSLILSNFDERVQPSATVMRYKRKDKSLHRNHT